MTEIQQTILKQLENSSSAKPMSFRQICELNPSQTGAQIELNLLGLYMTSGINQAKITKRDPNTKELIEQMYYWPTAVINNPGRQHIVISPHKLIDQTLTRAPRRDEIKQAEFKKETDNMPVKNKAPFSAVTIVQSVVDTPKITFNDLIKQLINGDERLHNKARDMIYYVLNAKYLSKDVNQCLKLGSNEKWLAKHGFIQAGEKTSEAEKPAEPKQTLDEMRNTARAMMIDISQSEKPSYVIEVGDIKRLIELLHKEMPADSRLEIDCNNSGDLNLRIHMKGTPLFNPSISEISNCFEAIKALNAVKLNPFS